jgi:phospholipid/cholesterol/gamma-HCH transport system substrate-binding protein
MREKRFAGRVGLFAVFAIVVAGVLLYIFSKSGGLFRPTYDLRLKANTVSGLVPGAAVLLSGVVIGKVVDADVAPGGRGVHIRIRINEKYHIHSDARFVIEQIGFLGDQYVAIYPQENQGDILGPGAIVEHVEEPFNFQEIGRSATDLIDEFSKTAKILNEAIGRANRVVFSEETLTNASATLANFRVVSEKAVVTMDALNGLVQSNAAPVGLAITNFTLALTNFLHLSDELREMVATNRHDLSLAVKNLEKTTRIFEGVAQNIADGKGLAGTLVKDGPFQHNVTNLVATLNLLSSNLNEYGLFYNTWLGRKARKPAPVREPARVYPGRNPVTP